MINQLSLFDPEKYSTPSTDGQPDWAYDVMEGDEYSPSVSQKNEDSLSTQTGKQGVESAEPLPPSVSSPLEQINQPLKSVGGIISTPGEEAIAPGKTSYTGTTEPSNPLPESGLQIAGELITQQNLKANARGDRATRGDRTSADPATEVPSMLQNIDDHQGCSVASGSNPLTVEEGKAFWEDLIFGQKNTKLGGLVGKPAEFRGDRNLERNDHQRVQSPDSTPDIAFIEGRINAIYRAERTLSDQRRHNGKPGASGWIAMQFKYRDEEGKSKTCTQWKAGCTGPYFQYQWRDGDRVRSRYIPRKKLEQVEIAIATRDSPRAILEILD